MLKKIKVEEAIGTKLAHDITEIRPGEFKGPAFRKGHMVCNDDICHLQKVTFVIFTARQRGLSLYQNCDFDIPKSHELRLICRGSIANFIRDPSAWAGHAGCPDLLAVSS